MKEELRRSLADAIAAAAGLSAEAVLPQIAEPKNPQHGDLAFPCFLLAKSSGVAPPVCAERLKASVVLPAGVSEATVTGPFLNFRFDRPALISAVTRIVSTREALSAAATAANEERVVVEYSSPNIAKPFHVGHLRATLIGNSLDRVYRRLGYPTVSVNHLGDWGTQFGFVWAGCEIWGRPANPSVHELVELYRRATGLKDEQERDPTSIERIGHDVNEMARAYFVRLERGEPDAVSFWQWCLDISLTYLRETYARLGVAFDHYTGESFYSDKLDAVRQELESSGILVQSEGAWGVDLGEELGFARILTPDGRSLYLTRDLAAAEYRAQTFSFSRAIYVVGAPQSLHFQQIKAIFRKLGKPWADSIFHVAFGHVLGMKTRGEGGAIELNHFLDEAFERALTAYREQVTKRPEGLDEDEVARNVALAAIIFSNLNRSRMKDVTFSWDTALAFQGDSGPYVLYAYARINGIKEKARDSGIGVPPHVDGALLEEESAFQLASLLADRERILGLTIAENEPAHLAAYVLDVAKMFSRAYNELKVVGEEPSRAEARLGLFEATRLVLKEGIELLGMRVLERM